MGIDQHELSAVIHGQAVYGKTPVEIEEFCESLIHGILPPHGTFYLVFRERNDARIALADGIVEGIKQFCRMEIFGIRIGVIPELPDYVFVLIHVARAVGVGIHLLKEIKVRRLFFGERDRAGGVLFHRRAVLRLGIFTAYLFPRQHPARIHKEGKILRVGAESDIKGNDFKFFPRGHRLLCGAVDSKRQIVFYAVVLEHDVQHVAADREQQNAEQYGERDRRDFQCLFHLRPPKRYS